MEDILQNTPDIQPQTGHDTLDAQPSESQSEQNLHQETQREHSPTPQESFQELRKRAEQAERERNEALGFIRQLEQYAIQQQQNQQAPVQQEPAYSPSYGDDDLIEGKHLKAEFSALKREIQEQKRQAEEARRMAETNSIETRLRSKFNDFDSIVTYENIQKLRELKPEIAASLHQTQDLYNKAAATYTILKDLGIARTRNYEVDHQRAQQNLNKPKAVNSIAPQTSLSHATEFSGSLTEDRKRQIYEQMLSNARRN